MTARVFAIAAGLLLVVAAMFKTVAPAADGNLVAAVAGRLPALLTTQIELALGVWLLSGVYPLTARWIVASLFLAFAAVNAWLVLQGESSCGCLGSVR